MLSFLKKQKILKNQNTKNYPTFVQYEDNPNGVDYVCGDIHGQIENLMKALTQINFDPERDRLFCCGDLVDRGPQSNEAYQLLKEKWFFSVRGNHDNFVVRAYEEDPTFSLERWFSDLNGGKWWEKATSQEKYETYKEITKLPYAIDITYPDKKVGIVHADIPEKYTWSIFTNEIKAKNNTILKYATESRKRAKYSENTISKHYNKSSQGNLEDFYIKGVDIIYIGHTVQREPTLLGNFCIIDTGSGYEGYENGEYQYKDGKITIVDIKNNEIVF